MPYIQSNVLGKICPKVEVKTVQFDFGTTNLADYDRLEAELKDLDVAVLGNFPILILETSCKWKSTIYLSLSSQQCWCRL